MDMMTAVATGGPRIQEVDRQYQERRRKIRALLRQLGLEDPNPHVDLWAWYGKWSRDFGTYAERRSYIRDLFHPLLERLDRLEEDFIGGDLPGSDNLRAWRQYGQVAQLRVRLATAASPEDAQAVGLVCRDVMISLAEVAHDPAVHSEVGTSAVDRLNAVVDYYTSGAENEKLRRLLKSTIDYANVVQHRRGVSPAEAGLVAEATVAAVNLIKRVVEL